MFLRYFHVISIKSHNHSKLPVAHSFQDIRDSDYLKELRVTTDIHCKEASVSGEDMRDDTRRSESRACSPDTENFLNDSHLSFNTECSAFTFPYEVGSANERGSIDRHIFATV